MSSMTAPEKRYFVNLFGMRSGYVLDFTDATFEEFFHHYGIQIHDSKYQHYGSSKAKKLRAFWEMEDDDTVGRVLSEMVDYYEADGGLNGGDSNSALIEKCRQIAARLRTDSEIYSPRSAEPRINHQPDTPALSKLPVEGVVQNTFTTNIYGNQNVVAAGVNVHQEITPVKQGDIQSLLDALRELNLAGEDLSELQTAVTSEPTAEKDSFGSKVNAWIGKMAGKAATGAFKFGADQTTTAILQALNGYYGN